MQDFIQAPPAPAAAAVPDDHWTCVTALRLQLAENDLDFSKARAQLAEKRMQRANFMVGKCLTRVAIADESLSAAKLALTEARQELDAAELAQIDVAQVDTAQIDVAQIDVAAGDTVPIGISVWIKNIGASGAWSFRFGGSKMVVSESF